ncbi:MAG: trypsin-like serine protease, partial [Acidobacteriota bacterium]
MKKWTRPSIPKLCATAALCALGAAAAAAQVNVNVPPMGREAFEATQPQVDPSLLPRVDHGDGTWSYQPGPQVTPDLQVQGGIVLWRYDGQARFSHEPDTQTEPGPYFRVVPQPEDTTPFEQLTSLVRIDRWGHRWRAEAADLDAWTAAIMAEDANSEEPLGGPAAPNEPPPQPGTVEHWEPHSWTSNNCNANRKKEERVWDGDGRLVIGTPDVWESTAVQVVRGLEQCSGVILTQDFVLTSAHCVSDDRNRSVPTGIVSVCRNDTAACIGAADITFPRSYRGGSGSGGGTDFADDWALIELDSTWTAAGFSRAEDMDMSRAGDSVIDGLSRIKNLG